MTPNQVTAIADLITGDPDVFAEEAIGTGNMTMAGSEMATTKLQTQKPLNSIEVERQARDIGGTDPAANIVSDQIKAQQDLQKQQDAQRQQVLEPQLQQLNTAMDSLQTQVQQGKQATVAGNQQYTDLDSELAKVNTLMGGIQKQL